MKLRTALLITILSLFAALPAMAMTLDQARRSGSVGEQLNGFLTVLKPSTEAKALVADVNAKRKKAYQKISKENGQPITIVAKLAAEQIVKKLPPNSKYQAADKSWKTK